MTFAEWVAHWGEARRAECFAGMCVAGHGQWSRRNIAIYLRPCWELVPGFYWTEAWDEISATWLAAGGRCFAGSRMIAAKWDDVWLRFATAFPFPVGKPHPPYGLRSCARWKEITSDEAIALGVVTRPEIHRHTPRNEEAIAAMRAIINGMPPDLRRQLDEEPGL